MPPALTAEVRQSVLVAVRVHAAGAGPPEGGSGCGNQGARYRNDLHPRTAPRARAYPLPRVEEGAPLSCRPARSLRRLSGRPHSRPLLLDQTDEPEQDMGPYDHRGDADDHEGRRSVLTHPPSSGWRMEFDPHGHDQWIRAKARSCQLVYRRTARRLAETSGCIGCKPCVSATDPDARKNVRSGRPRSRRGGTGRRPCSAPRATSAPRASPPPGRPSPRPRPPALVRAPRRARGAGRSGLPRPPS